MFTPPQAARRLFALAAPVILTLAGCNEGPAAPPATPRSSATSADAPPPRGGSEDGRGTYQGLRERALAFRIPTGAARVTPHQVHGIIVDWGMDVGTTTIVFMNDGSGSLYHSGGGGVIGAGRHPEVRDAGVKVLDEAARVMTHMSRSAAPALPAEEQMRFTLIIDEGFLTAVDTIERLSDGVGPFAPLGNLVQDLIFAIRQAPDRSAGG